jgi:hypothetical protein
MCFAVSGLHAQGNSGFNYQANPPYRLLSPHWPARRNSPRRHSGGQRSDLLAGHLL